MNYPISSFNIANDSISRESKSPECVEFKLLETEFGKLESKDAADIINEDVGIMVCIFAGFPANG